MVDSIKSNIFNIYQKTSSTELKQKINNLIFKFNAETTSDGVIGDFKQSSKCGDCYLLSSLYSISKTTKGAEILKNNIQKDKGGGFTITLPGAIVVKNDYEKNKKKCFITGKYTISRSEIRTARRSGKYSKGDFDVLLYELAFEKYRKEVLKTNKANHQSSVYGVAGQYAGGGTYNNALDGGQGHDAMFILTGKQSKDYEISSSSVVSINSDNIKKIESTCQKLSRKGVERLLNNKEKNPQRYSITFNLKLDNGTGKDGYHALSISRIENGRVYFVNPWNSKKEFSMTKDEFFKSAYQISVADMEEASLADNVIDGAYNAYGNFLENSNHIYNNIINLFKDKK